MAKLIKYEFRKTLFSKLILLVITAVAEVLFLGGIFLKWENGIGFGTIGLSLCAMFGILYIGIESLLVYQRDLNTKQSYMLFLTPTNSYQVLGAKVIENGVSIFLAGAFFTALGVIDAAVAVINIGGLEEFLDLLNDLLISIQIEINVPMSQIIIVIVTVLISWLLAVVTGYFAILLSATVFAGKKFSGFVSFLIYMMLNWAYSQIIDWLPEIEDIYWRFGMISLLTAVLVVVMYLVAGWVMERKLSV